MARSIERATAILASEAPLPGILRPRLVALAPLIVLASLGWIYLGLMVGGAAERGLGAVPRLLEPLMGNGSGGWLEALCRPAFGRVGAESGFSAVAELVFVFLMWAAMASAMMLPTAAPMVLTYAEIAETAATRREPVVSPLVLTAGYLMVWLAFAVAAAVLQWGLTSLAASEPAVVAAGSVLSGATFIAAGAYQFSPLKHACLTACQRPFPYLFAHWSSEPAAVFRLGLRQGLYCLGCCWAMMLLMLAVGVMNVVWMAGLGAIMAAEKTTTTSRFSRAVGVVLVAAGVAMIVASAIGHGPLRIG